MRLYFLLVLFLAAACNSNTDTTKQTAPKEPQKTTQSPKSNVTPAHLRKSTGYESVTAATFKDLMDMNSDAIVIDVRTPQEIAQGKIEGAMELDLRSAGFADKIEKLDKDKQYLVYCAVGARSEHTCKAMSQMGFKSVYNLQGGYVAWKKMF